MSVLFPPPLPPVRHAGSGMTQGGPNTRHLSQKRWKDTTLKNEGKQHHSKGREWKAAPLSPHHTREGWERSTAQEEEADHYFTSPFFTLLQLRVLNPTSLILIFFLRKRTGSSTTLKEEDRGAPPTREREKATPPKG